MLSPEIYQDVIDAIEIQSKQIKEDRVTMRFEPRFVEYEEKSDKVFAYGYSYVKGASSQQGRNVGSALMSSSSKFQITPLISITWVPIWVSHAPRLCWSNSSVKKKKRNREPMKLNAKYPLLRCLPCTQQG